MRFDREPHREIISRGQLYMLNHPGSEMFSGYGLTTHEGRNDHLVGILMVDRPRPVDSAWLAQIKALYGDYQFAPMTATGERGLVTQMRIARESVRYLQPALGQLALPLKTALLPLLDHPPAPILKLHWEPKQQSWASEFWLELPATLQEVFRKHGYGCLAVQIDDAVSMVTHVSHAEIESFRVAPVLWRWELIKMPTAPLIRFQAIVFDNPRNPYRLEHFLNVGEPQQARYLSHLVRQEEITLDLFGDEFEYAYSKRLPHPADKRAELDAMAREAIEYYGLVSAGKRNFDKAKAEYQRKYPL